MIKFRTVLSLAVVACVACFASVSNAGVMHVSTFTLNPVLSGVGAEVSHVNSVLGKNYVYLDKLDDSVRAGGGLLGDGMSAIGTISGLTDIPTSNITWNLEGTNYGVYAILVKDGRLTSPPTGLDAGHLYSLYKVDGLETKNAIDITVGFPWNNSMIARDISHITFLGQQDLPLPPPPGPAAVPEPASAMIFLLLGAASLVPCRFRKNVA